MNKDETIHLAMNIYEEALMSSSYYNILKQYEENINLYYDEMNISTGFYHVIHSALIEALFMNLSKIYDENNKSLTLRDLLKELSNLSIHDLDDTVKSHYIKNNNTFVYRVSTSEECFFKGKVSLFKENCRIANIPYKHTVVYISLSEFIDFYFKKYHSMHHYISNLIMQRNKIYAHNDRNTNFNFSKIVDKFPIKIHLELLFHLEDWYFRYYRLFPDFQGYCFQHQHYLFVQIQCLMKYFVLSTDLH